MHSLIQDELGILMERLERVVERSIIRSLLSHHAALRAS